MLTIFRRHKDTCKFAGKGRKHRHCTCPIAVEGKLRGKMIRRSLDVRNWEAAQKMVREMESSGVDVPTLKLACERFLAYQEGRGLNPETIRKFRLLFADLPENWLVSAVTPDDLAKIFQAWDMAPSSTNKKLERLRAFFNFCVERRWIERSPAQGMKGKKELAIDKKPYEAAELEKITWAIPLFPIKGIYGDKNRERIAAFVAVLRWTGLRIRDVVQLKWSAIADKLKLSQN